MIHADDPFFRVYTYWNILLGVEYLAPGKSVWLFFWMVLSDPLKGSVTSNVWGYKKVT